VITVVGIGADGWAGLGETARAAIEKATTVVGSARQLELLPQTQAQLRVWPSPMTALLDELVAGIGGEVCVLASGDPMLHGIGATLARRLGPEELVVHPHPSAFALACARLGWPAADVELVSAVAREPEIVARVLQPGRKVVVYSTGAGGALELAQVLVDRGFGPSTFTVLERLGAEDDLVTATTADDFEGGVDPLHVVAIDCVAKPGTRLLALSPGLPDEAYENDGQLTKRHIRAATLAALAPTPGGLLWDIGAGSGSIGIEWLRAEASAAAVAIEPREERAERAKANALALGVSDRLTVVAGEAPGVLDSLAPPDAIFIGGGVTSDGLLARCWDALQPGGRLVANAVTLEGEQVLQAARALYGGDLIRLDVSHAEPIGSFTGWRAQMPVVQWSVTR
jgi:precorrin-6Y C5,15-methyltransferase (decarboxylating)